MVASDTQRAAAAGATADSDEVGWPEPALCVMVTIQ